MSSQNPVLSREEVHRLSEECATMGTRFQSQAQRLLNDQPVLLRFFKSNLSAMSSQTGEVTLYLLAVCVRVFVRSGGRLRRVTTGDVELATRRIGAVAPNLLPADAQFPERLRTLGSRAQPHLLDEALWALFERKERQPGEVDLEPDQALRVFLMLWAAVECLDAAWTPKD